MSYKAAVKADHDIRIVAVVETKGGDGVGEVGEVGEVGDTGDAGDAGGVVGTAALTCSAVKRNPTSRASTLTRDTVNTNQAPLILTPRVMILLSIS